MNYLFVPQSLGVLKQSRVVRPGLTAFFTETVKPRRSAYSVGSYHMTRCRSEHLKDPTYRSGRVISTMVESGKLRYVDVGINLGDPIFTGVYHGKRAHQDDRKDVIQRAMDIGCTKMMVTGSSLIESKHAIDIAKEYPGVCYATVGVHPCSTKDFDRHPQGAAALLEEIKMLAVEGRDSGYAVAFGEFGLDYDRLFLSPKDVQLKYFEKQLDIAVELQMPLFLHSRACSEDFERLLKERLQALPRRGVVHSFTGTVSEMKSLLDMGFHIGVNGCSLKTEENLEVVRQIPLDRLQLETDGPWCEIRASHASSKHLQDGPTLPKGVKKEKWLAGCMVKGRNEPVAIALVAHVVAKVKGVSVEEVCQSAWTNSVVMFRALQIAGPGANAWQQMFGLGEHDTNP